MARRNKQEQKPVDREAIAAGLAASMPADRDGLLSEAMAAVTALHVAVLENDSTAATEAADRYEAAVWKLNGGTFFACRAEKDSAGRVIEQHCKAVPGQVPMWGQTGQFVIEVDGIRALVCFGDGFGVGRTHYEFHAVDLDRPFISETGYRSHFDNLVAGQTVAEAAAAIFSRFLTSERRQKIKGENLEWVMANPLPSWCSDLAPPARREPAAPAEVAPAIPAGFALVDVVLPKHKAFIVRKWAEEAKAKIEAAKAATLNAKGKRRTGRAERDPASSKATMTCSTVKSDDDGRRPAYWAGFSTGDRVRTKAGTIGVFVLGDDKFIGYLVPDKLAGGVPNPDAGKTVLRSHKFSVTPTDLEHFQEQHPIVENGATSPAPFERGQRCEIVTSRFPADIGKRIVVTRVNLEFRSVWAHDDKPIRYRINRNGRKVVDYDPRCIETGYGFDQLKVLNNQENKNE